MYIENDMAIKFQKYNFQYHEATLNINKLTETYSKVKFTRLSDIPERNIHKVLYEIFSSISI